MAKPGPKPKITDEVKREIYAIVSVGASLKDAADYLGVSQECIYKIKQKDPEFYRGVKKAAKSGKIKLIKKVGSAKAWQSAAWMLERRWGKQFGRKDHVSQTVNGELKHDHKHDVTHKFDHAEYEQEFDRVLSRTVGSKNGDNPARN